MDMQQPILEINMPPGSPTPVMHGSSNGNRSGANGGTQSSTPTPMQMNEVGEPSVAAAAAQAQHDHHQQQPRLKRSPYLATMCTTPSSHILLDMDGLAHRPHSPGSSPPGSPHHLEIAKPPFQAQDGDDEDGASRPLASIRTMDRRREGGNSSSRYKRQYQDFFELKRPRSSSIASSPPAVTTGTAAQRHRLSVQSATSAHSGLSGVSGVSTANSVLSGESCGSSSSNKVRRVQKGSGSTFGGGSNRRTATTTSSSVQGIQTRFHSVHSLPQRGYAAVSSSSHGRPHHRNHQGGNGRHSHTRLQYYYPNPFSQCSLLNMLGDGRGRGASMSFPPSNTALDPTSESSSDRSGEESSNEYSPDDDDSESTMEVDNNMRMSLPEEKEGASSSSDASGANHAKAADAGANSSAQQEQHHQRDLNLKKHQHTSQPSNISEQHKRRRHSLTESHVVRAQFFPSVLDPLDGYEYDVNRAVRNEAWKEICVDEAVLGLKEDDDALMEEDEEDGATSNQGFSLATTTTASHSLATARALRRSSCSSRSSSVHSFSGNTLPMRIVSDRYNTTSSSSDNAGCAGSLSSSDNYGGSSSDNNGSDNDWVQHQQRRRSSNSSNRDERLPKGFSTRHKCHTVGAGLAYGRIPDWHVRSRLRG